MIYRDKDLIQHDVSRIGCRGLYAASPRAVARALRYTPDISISLEPEALSLAINEPD